MLFKYIQISIYFNSSNTVNLGDSNNSLIQHSKNVSPADVPLRLPTLASKWNNEESKSI